MPIRMQLLPESTISLTGGTVTGAADSDDALREHDDDDYVHLDPGGECVVRVDDSPTITADQRVSGLRIRVKGSNDGTTLFTADFVRPTAGATGASISRYSAIPRFTQMNGQYILTDADGNEWTETEIDDARIRMRVGAAAPNGVKAIWADVEGLIHFKPTMQQLAVPIRDPSPLLKWSGVDNGDEQAAYHHRIFYKVDYDDPGFDVDVTTPVYDSGEVAYAGRSQHAVPEGFLDYGDAYVWAGRVATVFPGGPTPGETWWGDTWAFTEFETPSLPSNTPDGDSVGILDDSLPLLGWTYTDTHLKPVDYYDLEIYDEIGVLAYPLFPPRETAVIPGGPSGTTFSYQVKTPLLNGEEYSWLLIPHITFPFDFTNLNWIGIEMAYTEPPVPTITATPDATQPRIQVEVFGNTGHRVRVEKSIDGQNTWQPVRFATALDVTTAVGMNFWDYESESHRTVAYRAIQTTEAEPNESSQYSDPVEATLEMDYNWLVDPTNTNLKMHIISQDTVLVRNLHRDRTAYRPIGSSLPIVMSGEGAEESYVIAVLCMDTDEEELLKDILDNNEVLVHHTPRKMRYVSVAGDITEGEYLWADLHGNPVVYRQYLIPLIEVEAAEIEVETF